MPIQIFSAKRADLVFDFAGAFENVFSFSPDSKEEAKPDTSPVVKDLGYDFQNEHTPYIEITPPDANALKDLGFKSDTLQVVILIEDLALAIRETVYAIPLIEITGKKRFSIDLASMNRLAFYKGYEIRCIITRQFTDKNENQNIWHKSHCIYQENFVVKSTPEESLFDITYVDFKNQQEISDLLIYVDFQSTDVSDSPDTDCFQVKANSALRGYIKLLENNKNFGVYCIRQIARQVLKDICTHTLSYAKVDNSNEPLPGSLHEKVELMLTDVGLNFDELAIQIQQGGPLQQCEARMDLDKAIQTYLVIGSSLCEIKFGGAH